MCKVGENPGQIGHYKKGMPEHISELTPDPQNARAHNPRNVAMIVDALQAVGAARSIVIDEDGRILAGNATIEAAAEAGIERVVTVDADGETIVAVRRSGLTDQQKQRLAYFDNRTAELATWDAEQVMADVEAGVDLAGLFGEDELAIILEHPFGTTAIDRENQGVSSTWQAVRQGVARGSDRVPVMIGDIESHITDAVYERLSRCLNASYETDRTPFSDTLEATLAAGVTVVEASSG